MKTKLFTNKGTGSENHALTPELKLIAALIKVSLRDLYGKNFKNKKDAEMFFKSKLFEMTGLNFENLKKDYERIHHIK